LLGNKSGTKKGGLDDDDCCQFDVGKNRVKGSAALCVTKMLRKWFETTHLAQKTATAISNSFDLVICPILVYIPNFIQIG